MFMTHGMSVLRPETHTITVEAQKKKQTQHKLIADHLFKTRIDDTANEIMAHVYARRWLKKTAGGRKHVRDALAILEDTGQSIAAAAVKKMSRHHRQTWAARQVDALHNIQMLTAKKEAADVTGDYESVGRLTQRINDLQNQLDTQAIDNQKEHSEPLAYPAAKRAPSIRPGSSAVRTTAKDVGAAGWNAVRSSSIGFACHEFVKSDWNESP